jgi:3-deoxy-D-manno-octulosonic-acid transferase
VKAATPEAGRSGQPPLGWQYYLHNGILALGAPLIAGGFAWRRLVQGKSREGLDERLGRYPDRVTRLKETGDPVIWVHACSVGEVAGAASILAEIRKQMPVARLVLSTTTPTGRDLAEKRDPNVDALVYFPFDLPWVVRRALDAIRPDLLVTVDTELWPNLFALASQRGTRVAVANARFSDRAFRRGQFVKLHYRWILGNVDAVLAQSVVDAERYMGMGADRARVEVTGNVKFDEDFPQVSPAELAKLRQDIGLDAAQPVWVVGSTREGEEALVLDAFTELRLAHHDLQLLIAPRHPERGSEVARMVAERGYLPRLRTDGQAAGPAGPAPGSGGGPAATVFILDTIGELARVYALADVVTVGGSFVKWGGHNMLQPMAQGKPVVFGPHTRNFRDIVSVCLQAEAAIQLSGAGELAGTVARLLSSSAEAQLLSLRALRVVQSNQGASARTAQRLVRLMERSRE